jgi:uncharacterized protein
VRVVLDSNVVVSACLSPQGASATIVELALLGHFTLCISREVLSEYREVLARPKFSRQLERITAVLEGIEEIAEMLAPQKRVALSPDEDDNRLLELAQAGKADFLVTGNRKHFPERLDDTRILSPREFVTQLVF